MEDNFCYSTSVVWQFVGYAVYALKILVPLIIIILAVVDFSRAVVSSDEKAISASAMSLVRRLAMGILIFFVPSIVRIVGTFVADMSETFDKTTECIECLTRPTGDTCKKTVENSTAEIKSNNK